MLLIFINTAQNVVLSMHCIISLNIQKCLDVDIFCIYTKEKVSDEDNKQFNKGHTAVLFQILNLLVTLLCPL